MSAFFLMRKRVEADKAGRIDPNCRLAQRDPIHCCFQRGGGPIEPGGSCWAEQVTASWERTSR